MLHVTNHILLLMLSRTRCARAKLRDRQSVPSELREFHVTNPVTTRLRCSSCTRAAGQHYNQGINCCSKLISVSSCIIGVSKGPRKGNLSWDR